MLHKTDETEITVRCEINSDKSQLPHFLIPFQSVFNTVTSKWAECGTH